MIIVLSWKGKRRTEAWRDVSTNWYRKSLLLLKLCSNSCGVLCWTGAVDFWCWDDKGEKSCVNDLRKRRFFVATSLSSVQDWSNIVAHKFYTGFGLAPNSQNCHLVWDLVPIVLHKSKIEIDPLGNLSLWISAFSIYCKQENTSCNQQHHSQELQRGPWARRWPEYTGWIFPLIDRDKYVSE